MTTRFLDWCCDKLEQMGKKALLLIWDNASWHAVSSMGRLTAFVNEGSALLFEHGEMLESRQLEMEGLAGDSL